MKGEWEFFLCP